MRKKHTTVQIVPGGGPNIQSSSNFDVTRSGVGKQMGLTHRLKINGFSNRKSEISFIISVNQITIYLSETKSEFSEWPLYHTVLIVVGVHNHMCYFDCLYFGCKWKASQHARLHFIITFFRFCYTMSCRNDLIKFKMNERANLVIKQHVIYKRNCSHLPNDS